MSGFLLALTLAGAAYLASTGRSPGGPSAGRRTTRSRPSILAGLGILALSPVIGVQAWAFALGAAALAGVVTAVVRGWVGRRHRRRRQLAVIDLCDALAAELHAGVPALVALERACAVDVELRPVGTGARIGADVPMLMRDLSGRPGLDALRLVGAGWVVASHTGAGLASVLDSIGLGLRHEEDARAEMQAALGPPRATARLLAILPVLGLALGESMGVHPTAFLLQTVLGRVCLCTGLVLGALGVLWVDRLAQAAEAHGRAR